jgi:hypothetical protein
VDRGISTCLEAATFGGVRSAAAATDIQPGDLLVSVPEHCLIHEETAQQSSIVSRELIRRLALGHQASSPSATHAITLVCIHSPSRGLLLVNTDSTGGLQKMCSETAVPGAGAGTVGSGLARGAAAPALYHD